MVENDGPFPMWVVAPNNGGGNNICQDRESAEQTAIEVQRRVGGLVDVLLLDPYYGATHVMSMVLPSGELQRVR